MKAIYSILIFLAGIFSGYLLFNHQPDQEISIHETKPPQIQKINGIDSSYQHDLVMLHKQNRLLQQQLGIANEQVTTSKNNLLKQRREAARLSDRVKLNTDSSEDQLVIDSLCFQIDSLNTTSDTLIRNLEAKNGISEKVIAARDSELVVCNQSFLQLKELANDQALREEQLKDNLNKMLREQKKQKVRSRLAGFALTFICGVTATTILLHNKQ